ncbi:MAG: hypothetical protein ACLSGB_09360 [Dorea sp.]
MRVIPTATDEVKTIAGGTGTVSNELAIVSSKARVAWRSDPYDIGCKRK